MEITQPPRSFLSRARKLLFALALVTCWCFVLIEFAGVALYQGVALGVTTAWLAIAVFSSDIRDLSRPISQRSEPWLHRARIVVLKIFAVALASVILIAAGGFSVPQGILLGMVLAWLLAGLLERPVKPFWRFSPYHVRVMPNWYQLLSDYKLIRSKEDWWSLQESLRRTEPGEKKVLLEGIGFTVIDQSKDLKHALIATPWGYQTEFNFEGDISPVRIENPHDIRNPLDRRSQPVTFFVRAGFHPYRLAGYGFGIEVPIWWWNSVKQSCPTPLHEDPNDLTGYVKLVLAAIPCTEFELYWLPLEWSDDFYYTTRKEIAARRDRDRKELGWTAEQFNPPPGLRVHFTSVDHKYFKVTHQEI